MKQGQPTEVSPQNSNNSVSETATPNPASLGNLESQPYINSKGGFNIRAPKGWRVDKGGQFGTLILFFNTQTDQEGINPFGANVNVTSKSTQGLNLDGYINATKDALLELLQNY